MVLLLGLLLRTVAAIRRFQLHRELAAMRLTQERDAAARQLAEARLKLLQGQIQPHFVFNTLAAIQHWVDEGDPRAGPLLRASTSFLRGSTELLGQESVVLAVEIETVRHYLSIMTARLGDRRALERAAPTIDLVAACVNGTDARDAWLEHQPDVCFLDIRMPGLTGIDVARRIAGRSQVVFVTGYGDHAIEAFDAGAIDCLLKPVEPARVALMIERLPVTRPFQSLFRGQ